MIYIEMFLVYLQIGMFSFGGGYAAMPLIQTLCVDQKGWLSMQEFADLTTIAEMTPGPIAVNSATFIGQKLAGFPGALVCTIGCIMPSLVIVLFLAWLYRKYAKLNIVRSVLSSIRPAVVAMIASAGMTILMLAVFGSSDIHLNAFHFIESGIFLLCLILLRRKKAGPIQIIFLSAILGTLLYLVPSMII
ncbi:MAG: chromate transporter [Bulleidia sp.]